MNSTVELIANDDDYGFEYIFGFNYNEGDDDDE